MQVFYITYVPAFTNSYYSYLQEFQVRQLELIFMQEVLPTVLS